VTHKGPTLAPSLALALSGAVIGIYGLIGAMSAWDSPGADAPVGKMVVMFVGGSMFAVGAMMLLVVTVRPLFEKREVDKIVDEIADELTDGRPRH
jgi:hypothetical protein